MSTNHKPGTPLPWTLEIIQAVTDRKARIKNAEYGIHTGNAYPGLVEMLKRAYDDMSADNLTEASNRLLIKSLLREIGEDV